MTSARYSVRGVGLRGGRIGAALDRVGEHHAVVALLLYAVAALVDQFHALAHLGSSCACLGDDPTQFMWSMVWWPHAIGSGLNPFVTHLIWVPHAINLAANTTIPGPALLATPLTLLAGPIVSYNVLSALAPITGAWIAYRLCLYITRNPAASILGGYLYGFSTYALAELEGHMQLVFTFGPPAVALLSLKRLNHQMSARRYLVLTAAVLIAQLSCGTEVTFTMTVMGAVALAAGLIFSEAEMRRRLIGLLAPLAGAFVVVAVVASPFLYYALTGPAVAKDRGLAFSSDALSYFIPTEIFRVGGHRFAGVSSRFAAGYIEDGTYLGLPLILMVAAYGVQRWRTRAGRILLSVLAVAVLWSLGTHLYISGYTTVPLPWNLIARRPVLNEILPSRIGLYLFLVCAVIVAMWVATPGSSRPRRWSLALLAVAFLIPNTSFFNQALDVPKFFASHMYRRYLRPNEIVLPLPYGPNGAELLWQAQAKMYFRLASGIFYVPVDYGHQPFVQQAIGPGPSPPPSTASEGSLRSFLLRYHVSSIVVDAAQPGGWPTVIDRLGLSSARVGGVLLYHVVDSRLNHRIGAQYG
jgi:hypothetical protein